MLVLEALMGLWFWAQWSSAVLLPSAPVSLMPASLVLESVWTASPDAAWSDPVQASVWQTYWMSRTGCCVDFLFDSESRSCQGKVRLMQQKTLDGPLGLRAGYVVVACG